MNAGDGPFSAVILAGGTGERLGGIDKAGLDVAGTSMLERTLAACAQAREVVVVGTRRPTTRSASWTLESPPGAGPVAGIAAGLSELPSDSQLVVVLACDLPYLKQSDVNRLLVALSGYDAVMFEDATGRAQPLAGLYRVTELAAAIAAQSADLHGRPVLRIVNKLRVATIADHGAARDCDTPDQLEAARRALR